MRRADGIHTHREIANQDISRHSMPIVVEQRLRFIYSVSHCDFGSQKSKGTCVTQSGRRRWPKNIMHSQGIKVFVENSLQYHMGVLPIQLPESKRTGGKVQIIIEISLLATISQSVGL